MVWTLSVTETIGYGALYYSFAVFIVPMRESLGTSVGVLTGAFSLALAVSGLAALLVGHWLDAYGARVVMTVGSLVGAAGLLAWSRAQSVAQLYAAFVVLGLAWSAVLYEPAFALVNRWFERDRPAALLTLTVVAGFASTVFLPLSQALEARLGWRDALGVLAGIVAFCAVPHGLLLRRSPADLGLSVDGRSRPAAATTAVAAGPADVRDAWRRRTVRWLTVAAVAETAAVTIVAIHLVSYLRDTDSSAAFAAAAAGALGILSVAGRLVVTAVAARGGLARTTAAVVAGQAVGVAALPLLPRPIDVVVFVLLFGAGFGVMTLARAALLGRYVDEAVYGRVSGRQTLAVNTGRIVAPTAASATIGWTGGYGVLLGAVAALTTTAALSLWRAHAAESTAGGDVDAR